VFGFVKLFTGADVFSFSDLNHARSVCVRSYPLVPNKDFGLESFVDHCLNFYSCSSFIRT
jgi:hypothetical protein